MPRKRDGEETLFRYNFVCLRVRDDTFFFRFWRSDRKLSTRAPCVDNIDSRENLVCCHQNCNISSVLCVFKYNTGKTNNKLVASPVISIQWYHYRRDQNESDGHSLRSANRKLPALKNDNKNDSKLELI